MSAYIDTYIFLVCWILHAGWRNLLPAHFISYACFIFVLSQLFFVFLGQLISDDVTEVISRYNKEFFTPYGNQLTTKSAGAQYDDSYLGKFCFDVVCGGALLPGNQE